MFQMFQSVSRVPFANPILAADGMAYSILYTSIIIYIPMGSAYQLFTMFIVRYSGYSHG